jgi:hypothetical protein
VFDQPFLRRKAVNEELIGAVAALRDPQALVDIMDASRWVTLMAVRASSDS